MTILQMLFASATSGAVSLFQRSLRFRASASAWLNRTPASAGNRNTWTWSGWVKRGQLGIQVIYNTAASINSNTTLAQIYFDGNNKLNFFQYSGVTTYTTIATTAVYRDPSAWYHIVVAYDDTQATASNRVKFYVNGVQITAFDTATYPTQNFSGYFNLAQPTAYARDIESLPIQYFDGYLSELYFIDGQALTPTSFGSFNAITGVWQPIAYSGSYGAQGYYLNFQDNSAATATTIGKDSSGNGNNWTPNNISVTAGTTYDSMTDIPTLTSATQSNYAVFNQLIASINGSSLTEASLKFTSPLVATGGCLGTIGVSSGKWYWEFTHGGVISGVGDLYIGIDRNPSPTAWGNTSATMYSYWAFNGNKANNATFTAYGASYTTNDVIGVALDMDAGTLVFYKNGTSQGTAFTGLTGTYFPAVSDGGGSQVAAFANFGQRPFSYTPPTGFVALNTFNLATPTIPKGNDYFDVVLRNGFGTSGGSITSLNFSPDFVWEKARNNAFNHQLVDSVRGLTNYLNSNLTNAETTLSNYFTAFNSNGYTLGNNDYGTGVTLVDWAWRASDSAPVTNTNGSITSSVSANTTSGFSVVSFTGVPNNASTYTIGHGLGVAPSFYIVKNRDVVDNWYCYQVSLGASARIMLDLSSAVVTGAGTWGNTAPTSTVFSLVGNALSTSTSQKLIAYCFAAIPGYSAFGSYTGNGSVDGPFVYTGMRSRWIMIKRTDSTANWRILDTSRDINNVEQYELYPNLVNAEGTFASFDGLSNGFKIRNTDAAYNTNGGIYIYAAFAENPFKNALAR